MITDAQQLTAVHDIISLRNSSKPDLRTSAWKNPYHPSHNASAHSLSLHIRDELCMLLLHIEDQHDTHQAHQLHL